MEAAKRRLAEVEATEELAIQVKAAEAQLETLTKVTATRSTSGRRPPMGSISRRPDGQWRARYRDEAGKEHARHFSRKVDAQRW